MFVTRKADYAVRCVLYLAARRERTVSVPEISTEIDVPPVFLSKILQRLAREGIVTSLRGTKGGFKLALPPRDINLLQVIEAIQGKSAANVCALDEKACGRSGFCSVHPIWVEIREYVERKLKATSFEQLLKLK